MWLLESDGAVLEGKRIWLRPGKTYLFGRTHSRSDGAAKGFKIDHSTISRKHATITVELPRRGDVTSLTARSGLKIEDLKSKHGTFVGEQKLSGESLSLRSDQQTFLLGGFEETFSITWHSVVFTFKAPSRDKDRKALRENRSLLEPLDIKAIDKFDPDETTHVVSNKRNTPQTLQALVHAKYIVDDSILKELEYVTTEGNLDEPESMSRLELDFDAGWPDPLKFLPAVTREPNPKSEEYFKPDPSRNQVFKGYTFVMFDKKQYDGLQPAIAGGGGKAKWRELKLGQETVRDINQYMKEAFNAAEAQSEGSGYGVLHVRLVISDPTYEEWATRIQTESVATTGQGLVEQNEFLEAILIKDARGMVKKVLTQADSLVSASGGAADNPAQPNTRGNQAPSREKIRSQPQLQSRVSETVPVPVQSEHIQHEDNASRLQSGIAKGIEDSAQMEQLKAAAMARTRRLRTRTPAASAFRGFLDDPTEPEASFQEQAQVTNRAETPVTQAQAEPMDVDDSLLMEEDTTVFKSPRKRPLPPELESDEIVNAKLYPAQAAAKRRRLEAGESLEQVTDTALEEGQIEKINKTKTSKVRAEANYEERMKAIREKQEEVNDDELEPMHQQLEKMSFEEKQKLIRIAEFEIKPRERDLNNPQTQDRRWKDEWNGRKNFKGFQKRGQPNMARNGPKIIIALEPIKVQSATEEYLATKQTEAERRKAKRMEGEEEGESEASQDFTDANSHLGEPPVELLGDGGPEIIDVDAPRTTRASDRGSQAPSRTRTTATSVKRQASTTTKGPSKKRKKLNLNMGDEDASSEEDEIPKFRFKQK